MTQLIADSTQNTERSARLWRITAFIAGIIFMAVLAQTLTTVNLNHPGSGHWPGASGDYDSPAPVPMPDEYYHPVANLYRLAFTHPGPEGMLSG